MRSIRPQTVTLAVMAILFGLLAVWAVRQVLFARREQPTVVQAAPSAEPKVGLLVLQSNLVADARIREQDVAQAQEPLEIVQKQNIPLEKAFRFKQQAVGRVLKKAKLAATWLSDDDFYEIGKGPQLKLKEGMRAVTVRIDDPAVSSNIIQTGCLVDVIYTTDHPDNASKLTVRLASALEVLSPPVSDGGVPNAVTSVAVKAGSKKSYIVLEATPEQANRLAEAQERDGAISVTLCAVPGSGDGGSLDRKTVNALLSSGEFPIDERTLLNLGPRPGPPRRIVVEQYRGTKIDYVVFSEDNVRLTEERALQAATPGGQVNAAKPAKKPCKNCEKAREKARLRNGEPVPTPDATPTPTPAPPRTT